MMPSPSTSPSLDDRPWLRDFVATRSPEAFRQLVQAHLPTVQAAARRILGPQGQQHVEDVTQCVFILLARQAGRIPDNRPLIGWLYQVTHYACRNLQKTERRRRQREAAAMRPAIVHAQPVSEAEALLDQALQTLSSRDRDTLLLRYGQDLSLADIGRQTRVPPATAKTRLRRALVQLRKYFAAHGMLAAAPAALHALAIHPQPAGPLAAAIAAKALAAGTIGATATSVALAKGVAHMMYTLKLIKALGIASATAAGIASAGLLVQSAMPRTTIGTPPPEIAVANTAPGTQSKGSLVPRLVSAIAGISGRSSARAQTDARNRFLAVETFARMPAAEQGKSLPAFYRSVVPSTLNSLVDVLSSRIIIDILDPTAVPVAGKSYGGFEQYAEQLQAAVPRLTIEQVADKLAATDSLNLAAHSRTVQTLHALEKPLAALIDADLDSKDLATFNRGSKVVAELRLTAFTTKILDVYLGNDSRAKEASRVLVWLRDPAMVPRLLQDVERDPRSLARHADPLFGALAKQKAPPVLVKLLSSPDSEVRYHAIHALSECDDPALATLLAGLAKDKDVRTRELVMLMVGKLPAEAFASIRGELVALLRSTDSTVQDAAIKAFAGHKDLAVAPVIREFLATPPAKPGGAYNVTIIQALNTLTGSTFGYDYLRWGPEKNAAALAKFDQWIAQQRDRLPI